MEVLRLIKAFFNGVGNISIQKPLAVQYRVQSIQELSLIIDHFYKYPLISNKQADYLLFKEVILMMLRKEHLTPEGLEKIVSIKARGVGEERAKNKKINIWRQNASI